MWGVPPLSPVYRYGREVASEVVPAWSNHAAVLFDLDGVITPTAVLHELAWAELFRDWNYVEADYLAYIDGKPRYDGVASFLESRSATLPWGTPTDPAGTTTVCALGNRKNELFNQLLTERGVEPYPGTMALMDHLDSLGIAQAVVSSSKNAANVLSGAGLGDRFGVVVDGTTAAAEGLAGKPDPAMFNRGAELLGVPTSACVVVEDAVAGVAAGAAGDFAFVIGVDRGGNRDALKEAGADVVVADLKETLPQQAH